MQIANLSCGRKLVMKVWKVINLILLGLIVLSLHCFAKSAEDGYQSFSVSFEQDGRIIKPTGHVVNLEKKEFAIIVAFNG